MKGLWTVEASGEPTSRSRCGGATACRLVLTGLGLALASLIFGLSAPAATFVWDGGSAANDRWSHDKNWNPNDQPPQTGGTADVTFTGGIRLTPDANGGAWNINSITFDSVASGFTIGGGELTLQASAVAFGIANNSANTQVINNALVLGAAQSWTANTAALTLNGTIGLGAQTLTLTGAANTSAAGIVSGTGALVKSGTGTLTLSGANTYSGGTTVSGGTLQGTTTSLQGNIANSAALVFDQTTSGTYAGSISGTGSFTKQNTGTVTLTGVNSFTGAATVSGGTLALGGTDALADSVAVAIASGATVQLTTTAETVGSIAGAGAIDLGAFTLISGGTDASTTFSGGISGTGALVKNGTGTLTLTGANSYSGGTTINAGTLQGSSTGLQGNIANSAAVVFDQASAGTYAGVISGTGSFAKQNAGVLILSGANTFTGPTTVTAGTLSLGAANALADTTAVTIASGAMFQLAAASETVGSIAGAGNIDLGAFTLASGGTNASTTVSGAVTGSGGIVKTGSGTLTLSGTNTYSGGTTVSAGTLQGTTASLQGGITNNASVVFDQLSDGTYAGAMSGTGSLTKLNAGTLTLSGANTYSGGTTVTAGILKGNTTSLQGGIVNHAAVVFDQSAIGTYASVISGTGSLTKQNTGTLTLSGANTYSGGTVVSAGTLQGTSTSLQGDVTNNATVVFDQSFDGTYSGTITGTGSVTKQNSGTLTLGGLNAYSGGTTVTAGVLQGNTVSLQGDIANHAAVVFDQASAGTYTGAMIGTGSLTKQNTGTLTLSGANLYTGGTVISAGTLQGTTTSLQGDITNNAAVTFDQAGSGSYAGIISGTGNLTKQGTGTVTLAAQNTYTGDTTISSGTLAFGTDGALSAATSLTLNLTATLDLAGNSVQVATFAYSTATIDFGIASGTNHFLFTGGGPSTGTVTIKNFSSGDGDVFAFQTGAAGVDSGFVSGVYFYGIGGGVLGATAQTVTGYTGTWDFITVDNTPFRTWDNGGANDKWATAANWDADAPLVSGFGLKVALDAGSTSIVDDHYNLSTLRFNSGAGSFMVTETGGGSLTFGGALPGIIQLSNNAQNVNVPIALNSSAVVEVTGAGTLTLAGVVSGVGGINKVGDNTLVLAGANTYSGTTTVSTGTVVLQDSAALGSVGAGTTVNAGAALHLANNISIGAESLALSGSLVNLSGTNAYGGAITGAGTVTIDGGALTLSGSSANTYTGDTTVNSGTLELAKTGGATAVAGNLVIGAGTVQLSASEQIANTSAVSLTSAASVFSVGTNTETIGSLSGASSTSSVEIGSGGALVTGGNNGSTTFAGVISGAGELTKQGTGTFALSGTNTHAGATTVGAGTLVLQNSAALGTSAGGTTVSGGATLQLENNISVGAEGLTLDGALRNAAGANTYGGAISGTGGITVDAGTLTLAGVAANTFTGTTTVSSGTLELNKTAGLNAVSGDLMIGNGTGAATTRLLAGNQISDTSAVTLGAGGTPVLDLNGGAETIGSLASANTAAAVQLGAGGALITGANNASTAFAGVISGAGSLTKAGAGTFTLSGANSYSGGTTVSGGTLQGDTTSVQGAILNNAAVVFDQGSNGTYAGAMSGTGSLTKLNAGTLTLSGVNTYSGGTTITAGALHGTTASLQGAIVNHAAVIFDQSINGTYAGAMTGTGSLAKLNTGTLTLSGTNTYSGGTTISAGTLQGTTTSLQGSITNNAAVVFDQTTNGTYSGAMSGTGSLTKQNTGTVVLSGENTYSGGTTVSAGTLQGNTTSLQGNIANSGTVVFDQTTSGTYTGVISGSGALTKNNTGTLTLSGANTYTGATTIDGGTLTLGASNRISDSSSVTLGYGSTLSLGGAFSDRVNVLSFNNATVDFGTTGTANHFLFGSGGTNTGTLTINNWTNGSDVFGVASNTLVTQSFLDNLLFSGLNVGIGAVLSATPAAVGAYGNFYAITPIPTFVWNGGQSNGPVADQDNWSKGNNWVGGIEPAIGATKAIVMAGIVRTTNDMNGAYQINSLLFRSDAGAFTINSSTADTLTVRGGGINNQSPNTQTLNVAIALGANQSWTAGQGDLFVTGSVLNSTHTLTVTGDFSTTISGAITSGSGGLVKNGTGVLTLSGTNTFTGGVTLNEGIVSVGADANLGASSGGLTFNSGTLRTTAGILASRTIALNAAGGTFNTNGFDSTLSGAISGSGALAKSGSGSLTLSGTNSYSGGTTISAGTLIGSTGSLPGNIANNAALTFDQASNGTFAGVISGTGSVTKQNSGTLTLSGANTYTGGTTVSAGTLRGSTASLQGNIVNNATVAFDQATNGTFAGVISGTGSVTKLNTGTLTLTGVNTYTGATLIDAGTLTLGASSRIVSTSALTISSGATFDVAGFTQTLSSLSGTGTVTLNGGSLIVGNNDASMTFGGDIAGAGIVEKIGSGTLAFNAAIDITGELKLSGGIVALTGANTISTLRISGNTTLDFGVGSNTMLTVTHVIVENDAVLTINNWVDAQNFFFATGSLVGFNTTTLVTNPASFDVRGSAPQNQVSFTGFAANSTIWQGYDRQITPAPEPATYGMLFIGAALSLVGYRRWRTRPRKFDGAFALVADSRETELDK